MKEIDFLTSAAQYSVRTASHFSENNEEDFQNHLSVRMD